MTMVCNIFYRDNIKIIYFFSSMVDQYLFFITYGSEKDFIHIVHYVCVCMCVCVKFQNIVCYFNCLFQPLYSDASTAGASLTLPWHTHPICVHFCMWIPHTTFTLNMTYFSKYQIFFLFTTSIHHFCNENQE